MSLGGPSAVAPGTENNEIGVPRLLLELTEDHRSCVDELGMRGPGEIGYLADICKPHVGVITNVGEAHIGRLGDREAIAKAKAELVVALPTNGVAVLNADSFFFPLLAEMAPCRVFSFGFGEAPAQAALHVSGTRVETFGTAPARLTLGVASERLPVQLQLPGRHNVANALAAAAGALAAGLRLDLVKAGLEVWEGREMRSRVIETRGGYTVIDDSYNANPTSTPEAMRMLAEVTGRRVFVFGDMLELGSESEAAHEEIGRLAAELGLDWLIAVGARAARAAEEAGRAGLRTDVVEDAQAALRLLRGSVGEGETVLVKASRRIGLERVVQGLLGDE